MQNESPIEVLTRTQLGRRLIDYAQTHHITASSYGLDPLQAGARLASNIVNLSDPEDLPGFLQALPRSPASAAMDRMLASMETPPCLRGPEIVEHSGIRQAHVLADFKYALAQQLSLPVGQPQTGLTAS